MMKKSLTTCPVCGGKLRTVEYRCNSCGTVIRGNFDSCEFCGLDEENLNFLRLFLKSRGNLSVIAKALGVSHPTARQKLDQLLRALGYETGEKSDIKDVLDLLDSGEISAEEAIKLLKGGK